MSLKTLISIIKSSGALQRESSRANDERVLGAIATLQEFYDRKTLHNFFHQYAGEGSSGVGQAFLFLERETIDYYSRYGKTEPFSILARRCLIKLPPGFAGA